MEADGKPGEGNLGIASDRDLLRELDLDTEPPSGLRTAPPSLRSNRRGL
jgi:hypothetical protein